MFNGRRRLAARVLAIGLLAATLTTVDTLIFPSPAEARCDGINREIRSTFSVDGNVVASETPLEGTCNENNIYRGVLKDERADGWCVSVWFREAETFWIKAGGPLCGAGNTSAFQWDDLNGNSRAYEQFCRNPQGNEMYFECGWGSAIGYNAYGVNHGY